MKDPSESLIGEETGFCCDRLSHGSGGTQPARELSAASGIGLYGVQQEAFAQEVREAGHVSQANRGLHLREGVLETSRNAPSVNNDTHCAVYYATARCLSYIHTFIHSYIQVRH